MKRKGGRDDYEDDYQSHNKGKMGRSKEKAGMTDTMTTLFS